jgi:DNA-directed RNA polymerase subunit RPC12/RpoP
MGGMVRMDDEDFSCPQCGMRLLQRKEAYESFQPEETELPECPRCRLSNPFGFLYYE